MTLICGTCWSMPNIALRFWRTGPNATGITILPQDSPSLEIIGEAARRVSTTFQEQHPEIPWRNIIGQRNILAHDYGQIDHDRLYKTAT